MFPRADVAPTSLMSLMTIRSLFGPFRNVGRYARWELRISSADCCSTRTLLTTGRLVHKAHLQRERLAAVLPSRRVHSRRELDKHAPAHWIRARIENICASKVMLLLLSARHLVGHDVSPKLMRLRVPMLYHARASLLPVREPMWRQRATHCCWRRWRSCKTRLRAVVSSRAVRSGSDRRAVDRRRR